jgi:hypothetical protein
MTPQDLTGEHWRQYSFAGRDYRIEDPQKLWMRPGGTTHRVLDLNGIVHCVPAPGQGDCVLTWKPKDFSNPVQF